MNWMKRGSYTVEGTVIISMICFIVGLVVLLGFYCHDRMIMQSTADELAMYGSLWSGRYLQPGIREVDYEAMKQGDSPDLQSIEDMGYRMLQGKFLSGQVDQIQVSKNFMGREITVDIRSDFKIFKWTVQCEVTGRSAAFPSEDLPRHKEMEQGEEMNEQRESKGQGFEKYLFVD